MDAYSPHAASMAKRACSFVPTSDRHSANPRDSQPSSSNHLMDSVLDALLGLSDASDIAIDLSFGRLLDSRASDTEQIQMIGGALRIGSALVEAGKRSARNRASRHNSVLWALPPDLTTRVFSMLDGQSLCYAAAACSMFNKCAMDPLCYANIDLTTAVPKVNNGVVSTMIHRAGKVLQSLKLGIVPDSTLLSGPTQPMVYKDAAGFVWSDKRKRQGKESSTLTRNCLISLSGEGGAAGLLLRRLHLYNIEKLDNVALSMALSACPHLLDLEIIGLQVELRQTLISVSSNCRLIERLSFESSKTGGDDSLKSPVCIDLVNNCPHLNSLALRGFKLQDYKARMLVKGFHKLKYVDFSTSYSITGAFLRNIGGKTGSNLLEVLILRDCMHLKEVEVAWFLNEVLAGDFKLLRHIDISNKEGLASEGVWYDRCYRSSIIPLKLVLEQRPHLCILAEFPKEGSFADIELMIDSDRSSEDSWASQLSSHTSDGSVFMSLSESSYDSDQGSGNEDGQDAGYAVYEESSDEVDFMLI